MVRKPKQNVRKEQFDLLKEQIEFWDARIVATKEILKGCKIAKNKNMRKLLALQKKYSEKNILPGFEM